MFIEQRGFQEFESYHSVQTSPWPYPIPFEGVVAGRYLTHIEDNTHRYLRNIQTLLVARPRDKDRRTSSTLKNHTRNVLASPVFTDQQSFVLQSIKVKSYMWLCKGDSLVIQRWVDFTGITTPDKRVECSFESNLRHHSIILVTNQLNS